MDNQTQRVADELFELAAEKIAAVEKINKLHLLPPDVGDATKLLSVCTPESGGATFTALDIIAFSVPNEEAESWRTGQLHKLSLIGIVNPEKGLGYQFVVITGWIETDDELLYTINRFTKKTKGVARITTVFFDPEDGLHHAVVDIGMPDLYVFPGKKESDALKMAEVMISEHGYTVISYPWSIK